MDKRGHQSPRTLENRAQLAFKHRNSNNKPWPQFPFALSFIFSFLLWGWFFMDFHMKSNRKLTLCLLFYLHSGAGSPCHTTIIKRSKLWNSKVQCRKRSVTGYSTDDTYTKEEQSGAEQVSVVQCTVRQSSGQQSKVLQQSRVEGYCSVLQNREGQSMTVQHWVRRGSVIKRKVTCYFLEYESNLREAQSKLITNELYLMKFNLQAPFLQSSGQYPSAPIQ